MRLSRQFLAGLLLLLSAGVLPGARAGEVPVPAPSGFVTDLASVIGPEREAEIISLLNELERRTGAEIAVLTVQSTQPLSDLDYALTIFDRWKIGKRGRDNGLLILLAVRDRRVRIIPGRGVRRIFPKAKIDQIVDRWMVPEFRQGHYGLGILQGARATAREIATDTRIELGSLPPLGREEAREVRTDRLQSQGLKVLIFVLPALLVLGLLIVIWQDYRRLGKISKPTDGRRSRGAFGGGSGAFGGAGRGW